MPEIKKKNKHTLLLNSTPLLYCRSFENSVFVELNNKYRQLKIQLKLENTIHSIRYSETMPRHILGLFQNFFTSEITGGKFAGRKFASLVKKNLQIKQNKYKQIKLELDNCYL
eukprot:TRINITY_DN9179_c0_g1_i10.p3 TRINITY_DN9179_c0_g1~~TRINITY_DN9179_c0_g1_i10.p3  ORF type:complete len:113 (-),score=2.63 TRINITY_DN9179_c0_g1_i10:767-1105(-)